MAAATKSTDLNGSLGQFGAIFFAVALIVCSRWFLRSDLSDAIADSVRRRHGGGLDSAALDRIDELSERMEEALGELRAEVMELSERMLVEVRGRKALGDDRAYR
ncbi:MAG: hypothetical protein ACE5HT_01565 [Gemmatimonadales bacterium]